MLILFAGLSTCDPGNILDSIKAAKQQRVRASVIGLAAEVRICRVITDVRASALLYHVFTTFPGRTACDIQFSLAHTLAIGWLAGILMCI